MALFLSSLTENSVSIKINVNVILRNTLICIEILTFIFFFTSINTDQRWIELNALNHLSLLSKIV
jgi:hypothetical protein